VTDLPPPTDDELLLAFVEMCPNMAMQDYVRRTGIDYRITFYFIYDHFESEWNRRMNDK
jgi:hypothetical protein